MRDRWELLEGNPECFEPSPFELSPSLCLAACPSDQTPAPDDPPSCPGQTIFGTYDPASPLYGDTCPIGAGCAPDPEIPGGYAGRCADEEGVGTCRPLCGYYADGANHRQCCLRSGREMVLATSTCVCTP